VREYSRLDLTHESDRLVALAGLAEAINRKRKGDVYLAGLWKNTLVWDLLWSAHGEESRRLGRAVAPTWSWASVTGGILYPLTEKKALLPGQRTLCPKFQIKDPGVHNSQSLLLSGYAVDTQFKGRPRRNDVTLTVLGNQNPLLPQLVAFLDVFHPTSPGASDPLLEATSLRFLVVCWLESGPCGLLLLDTGDRAGPDCLVVYERVGFVRSSEKKWMRMSRRGSYDDITEAESRTIEEMMSRMSMKEESDGVGGFSRDSTPWSAWSHVLTEGYVAIR
jgi:hypothetical protein